MTSIASLFTGQYPALMLVGGDAFHDIDSDAPFINSSSNAIILLPQFAEYCSSDVSPINFETTGNVGKTL